MFYLLTLIVLVIVALVFVGLFASPLYQTGFGG